MNIQKPEKIVVLGLMSHFPVAGVVWQTIHYLIGLQRLGYDVYYVEAHGCTPTKLMQSHEDDAPMRAAAYIAEIMDRFGMEGRWGYDTRYAPRRFFGMTELQLKTLYDQAAVLINLSGITLPLPEHTAGGRLVYLETDPVDIQIDLSKKDPVAKAYLDHHFVHFSFGENFGNPDCLVPQTPGFKFLPTRQPVVMDFWENRGPDNAEVFTTIGNWNQTARPRHFRGERYQWSKHLEFLKFIDLPSRTSQSFELALGSYKESDRQMLESNGWRVRNALDMSTGLDFEAYRDYITASRGEFTVAKDQNIRLRSGWFSDRAVTYLAAGRPVITQETGFSNTLPTGQGLFAFSTMEEILAAVDAINSNYDRHRRAAFEIAREYFSYEVVLAKLVKEIGSAPRASKPTAIPPPELVLLPTSRWPTRLPDATTQAAMQWPIPAANIRPDGRPPRLSIIIVVFNGIVYTRMCLTTLLSNTLNPLYEVIVVDNASTDETPAYLREVASLNPHVRVIRNETNRGFAAANNQGLAAARGEFLVLLNNDTIISLPVWIGALSRALEDPSVGLVGPVTNRTCNEAEIETLYRTYSELSIFARERVKQHFAAVRESQSLAFFCVAMRRDVYERLGPLDERFGIGSFEDDDYCMRAREAGYRLLIAEGVFVHHFGQGTLGELTRSTDYDAVYQANKRYFEEKWGEWKPHQKRMTAEYERLRGRARDVAAQQVPAPATILVISKGDEELLRIDGRQAWHFPRGDDGAYPYLYPRDSTEAIRHLKALRSLGATHLLMPRPAFWWRAYYPEFHEYLGAPVVEDESCLIFALNHE